MRSSADSLVLAMWEGRASWIGTAVDAAELASCLEDADNQVIPFARCRRSGALGDA